jgi:hypothetical protein
LPERARFRLVFDEAESALKGAQARRLFAEGAFELFEARVDVSVRVGGAAAVVAAAATARLFVCRLRVFVFRHKSSAPEMRLNVSRMRATRMRA